MMSEAQVSFTMSRMRQLYLLKVQSMTTSYCEWLLEVLRVVEVLEQAHTAILKIFVCNILHYELDFHSTSV